jgi:hypothetical protein
MNKRIWLSLAHMGGHEQRFIQEAFDTNWVVPLGPNVDGFEKDLEGFLGKDKHIVALGSGTAAIHLALIQLGVGPGDEVICQSFTFSASANPIKYLGAEPVFVDSEAETWNMSPEFLREAIEDRIAKTGKKPKAIIPVHLYGMPAKMDEIVSIANGFGIPVFSRHRLRLVGRTDGGLHPAFYSSPNGDIVEHRICEITRDSGYPPPQPRKSSVRWRTRPRRWGRSTRDGSAVRSVNSRASRSMETR